MLLRSRADKDTAKQNRYNSSMHYVYILRSQQNPIRIYIGLAENVENRLKQHNRGDSTYTKSFAPWDIEVTISFKSRVLAAEFERYLKSGSGHAFLKKRFLPHL